MTETCKWIIFRENDSIHKIYDGLETHVNEVAVEDPCTSLVSPLEFAKVAKEN